MLISRKPLASAGQQGLLRVRRDSQVVGHEGKRLRLLAVQYPWVPSSVPASTGLFINPLPHSSCCSKESRGHEDAAPGMWAQSWSTGRKRKVRPTTQAE